MTTFRISPKFWHFLVFIAVLILSLRQIYLNDIWWHLSIGREIFQSGAIPDMEFLTFPLQGRSAPSYEWGFGLIFYLAKRGFGWWGMSVLQGLCVATTLYFLVRASNRQGRISTAGLLVSGAVLIWLNFRIIYRPEIILYLALAIEIFLLERYAVEYQRKWLIGIPFLGFLLAQTHPSVIFLMFVLGAYGIQCAWHVRREGKRMLPVLTALFLTMVALIAAACLNPYGLEQLIKPFYSLGLEKSHFSKVVEYLPALESPQQLSFVVLAVASILAIASHDYNRIAYTLLLLAFGYLAFRYSRNIGLLSIVMFVPLNRALTRSIDKVTELSPRKGILTVRMATTIFLGFVVINALMFPAWGAGVVSGRFPTRVVSYLEAKGISGRVFNLLDIGGYLGWKFHEKDNPRVFIDGRQYGPNEGWNVYNHVLSAGYAWDYYLQQYDVHIIITPATFVTGKLVPLVATLADYSGWELVYGDQRALLFLRSGSEQAGKTKDRLQPNEIWRKVITEASDTIAFSAPGHEAFRSLGIAHFKLQQYAEAENALQVYLQGHPEDQSAWALLEHIRKLL